MILEYEDCLRAVATLQEKLDRIKESSPHNSSWHFQYEQSIKHIGEIGRALLEGYHVEVSK